MFLKNCTHTALKKEHFFPKSFKNIHNKSSYLLYLQSVFAQSPHLCEVQFELILLIPTIAVTDFDGVIRYELVRFIPHSLEAFTSFKISA